MSQCAYPLKFGNGTAYCIRPKHHDKAHRFEFVALERDIESPAPAAPDAPDATGAPVSCSCRHEPSFHGASGCMDDDCGCIASGDECLAPPATACGRCGGTGKERPEVCAEMGCEGGCYCGACGGTGAAGGGAGR